MRTDRFILAATGETIEVEDVTIARDQTGKILGYIVKKPTQEALVLEPHEIVHNGEGA